MTDPLTSAGRDPRDFQHTPLFRERLVALIYSARAELFEFCAAKAVRREMEAAANA